jgi:hypothetical protein
MHADQSVRTGGAEAYKLHYLYIASVPDQRGLPVANTIAKRKTIKLLVSKEVYK